MSVCETCPMEEKIYVCCARYPNTGEQVTMVLADGTEKKVCPYLGCNGACSIYGSRPDGCMKFYCDRFLLEQGKAGYNPHTAFSVFKSLFDL